MKGEFLGLLLADKPEGPTSHDVVDMVRSICGVRRVGHTGTLDPFASGLLILCLGWVTRLAEYVAGLPKIYRGVVRLGAVTDTGDRTGRVIDSSEEWRRLSLAEVEEAARVQVGKIEQRPPDYSAKKLKGRRAYALARAGLQPVLQARQVEIRRFDLQGLALPDLHFEIECSGGTYIRAVARDLGEARGVGAHLAQMRRVQVGEFRVEDALVVGADTSAAEISAHLMPATDAVAHLPRVEVDREAGDRLIQGGALDWGEGQEIDGPVAIHAADRLLAIGRVSEGRLWPKKVFATSTG
ncbi:MAG: tRNA pseudouridine(55) synthase TruB [Gemmatimonadota bacterium]|nr:MAG: tRNA pseudouridine(55) synthase TruB [Gemmatimonadota bacterium]